MPSWSPTARCSPCWWPARFPFYILLSVFVTPIFRSRLNEKFNRGAENQAFLVESVNGIQTLKALAVEPAMQRRWEEQLAGYVRAGFRANNLGNIAGQTASLLNKLTTIGIIWLGAHLAMQGELTIGQLIAFNMLAGRVSGPILRLVQVVPIVTERAQAYKTLKDGGHASLLEYTETERERIERVQELAGARQRLTLERAAIAEARSNLQAITAEFAKLTRTELAQAETRALALSKELVKATHTGQRQRLTAPVDGTVQQLAVHTVGGVVTPAQPLLVVVPDEDQLEVEAWVENKDIGFVDAGQPVEIKVDAFPFTRYGMIEGEVVTLSKDAVQLEDVGYVFAARARMDKAQIAVENGKVVNLTPGMTVAVEIRTGEKRLIEYSTQIRGT